VDVGFRGSAKSPLKSPNRHFAQFQPFVAPRRQGWLPITARVQNSCFAVTAIVTPAVYSGIDR
jgi:hypothetical protein